MKNIVRAFVLALTLTGSAAYAKLTFGTPANPIVKSTGMVPSCDWNDPTGCHIHDKN